MVDLKDKLTVFVISAGFNPNYADCIKALEKQSATFQIDIIKDYSPMHVAFQEMLKRCKTDYYVEIDEDMILKPRAIEMMYNTISTVDEKCVMVGYKLHDHHINFNIYGVKIYKHNIFKNYPYNNNSSVSCEMEQLQRLKDDGYTYQLFGDILGEHSPLWTEELIFERYFNLMEKYKEFGYSWLEEVPRKLWKLFQENPSKLNLSAMLGAYTSISSEKKLLKGEKSFIASQVEGLIKMDSYLEFPKWATFYLTNRCNYRCKYCALTLGMIDHMPDMTFAKAVEVMDKFPSIQNVALCGFGDPLLCRDLFAIIDMLKSRKKYVGVITNGSLLEKKLDIIGNSIPNYISISLNGSNAATHLAVTGVDDFETVLRGIRKCVSMGILTYLSYICTKENWKDVKLFIKLAKELKVSGVHLHNLLPHFDSIEDGNFWDLVFTVHDKHLIDEMKKDENADIVLRYPVLIEKGVTRTECRSPWRLMNVDGAGNVGGCLSVAAPQKIDGNIVDINVWHNPYFEDLRKSLFGEQKDMCTKCFRNWKFD